MSSGFDPWLLIRAFAEAAAPTGGDLALDLIGQWVRSRKSPAERATEEVLRTHDEAIAAAETYASEYEKTVLESFRSMEQAVEELDPELQEPARRVVEASLDYAEADKELREALERNDAAAAAEARRKQERIYREIQTFEMMKGMHDAMKQTAATLGEIKAARVLANREQASQATFNKKMT